MNTFYCKCGWPVRTSVTITLKCPRCERQIHCDAGTPSTPSYKPPRWVRLLQRLSTPQDIGLGATVKRIAGKVGGKRFIVWSKRIGLPCGCTEREIEWNRLYPNPNYKTPKT